jgi:hypothetical protein
MMKSCFLVIAVARIANGFQPQLPLLGSFRSADTATSLRMVLQKPLATKKLAKIEVLKVDSDYLINPLKEVR